MQSNQWLIYFEILSLLFYNILFPATGTWIRHQSKNFLSTSSAYFKYLLTYRSSESETVIKTKWHTLWIWVSSKQDGPEWDSVSNCQEKRLLIFKSIIISLEVDDDWWRASSLLAYFTPPTLNFRAGSCPGSLVKKIIFNILFLTFRIYRLIWFPCGRFTVFYQNLFCFYTVSCGGII